jgi:leucyl-tRNA synthetase
MPVDWYNGGMEHTTLHLLYSRFWHKFLFDIGVVPTKEPYARRTSHGMILGEDGVKMSKSRGNVVNPDDVVRDFGADTLRLYEMFIGDFEKTATWSNASIRGCERFLDRVWGLPSLLTDSESFSPALETSFHKTIKKVTEDIEDLKFNTAIAAMMTLINEMAEKKAVTKGEMKIFLTLLCPFAPHVTEELWERLQFGGMACKQPWPVYDAEKCRDNVVEIVLQLSGKIRARIQIPVDMAKEEVLAAAKSQPEMAAALAGKTIVKEIYVPGKLINIVAK